MNLTDAPPGQLPEGQPSGTVSVHKPVNIHSSTLNSSTVLTPIPIKKGQPVCLVGPTSEDLGELLDISDPTIPDPLLTLPTGVYERPQAPRVVRRIERYLRKILECVQDGAVGNIKISDEFSECACPFSGRVYEIEDDENLFDTPPGAEWFQQTIQKFKK